ncbi:MAG: hypothetical protein RIN56_18865 [Sporomusaceae bacterium]|nr:hypothetical protein [Sporomusaceae bacterium]
MKKSKLIIISLALILSLVVVAGCGGAGDSKPQQQAPKAQSSMPTGDPMPMMKDMDASMQDMLKQVKAGQMMEAQKSAAQMAGMADKVMPHMTDSALKEQMKKAAYDLRDTMNGGKADQTVIEEKMKAMQDIMKRTVNNLQSQKHNH